MTQFQPPQRTVEIKINPKLHTRAPENQQEANTWALLDTVWDLLREYAVRNTLQAAREAAREAGDTSFPDDDEEVFRQSQAEHGDDAPKNHLDLAPDCQTAAMALAAAFQHLENETLQEAQEAGATQEAAEALRELGLLADGGLDLDAALKVLAQDPDLN
jgi:hypothetical protein